MKSITFWGYLTMWLYLPAKNLSNSEETWLCDCFLRNQINTILRGNGFVIILSSQKSIAFWGEMALWLYFPARNLSHSEGTWLCDYTFQSKIYFNLSAPDHVIILYSQKSIPFLGDLTMLIYFPVKNLSDSEETWLCDYTSSQKSIQFWGDLIMWLYFPVENLF